MKIKWIPLGILLIAATTISRSALKTLYPISEKVIERNAYSLAYDMQHRQARWVYEYLTPEKIQGSADRKDFNFQEDHAVPAMHRATHKDYAGSGFDRGHLCPAADARSTDETMQETFYFSNITPQCPQFNRGYWLQLERHVRDLARKHKEVHVFSGPLYLPYLEADGKRYVKYQVIGENDIAVPSHYFKVIFNKKWIPIEVYILPNAPISNRTPLEKFSTTVEKVERTAGLIFPKK